MGSSMADAAGYDVAVIGAGPAGLAAAVAAAGSGAFTALVDAGRRPGGQYWRHRDGDDGALHHDWPEFRRLSAQADVAEADGRMATLTGHSVWHVERDGDGWAIHALRTDETATVVRARTLVIATGAYDRQLPFPGWTLPGVYTAGAAQALLKGHGVVAGKTVVVAGTGPFLLPVAASLAEAGAQVIGVFEAGRPTAAARHPIAGWRNRDKLVEGAGYLRVLRRYRVPYRTRQAVIAAEGGPGNAPELERVTVARLDAGWRQVPGSERILECDTLAVGYGFTPQTEIAVQAGCAMRMDADGSLVAVADDAQRSSVDGVFVAGETCGVGGAALALAEGEIAGLRAAELVMGRPADEARLKALVRTRRARAGFAAVLQEAFPVRTGWHAWLTPATTVCRCEEVPLERLDAAVAELGAADARAAKLFARTGMGLCQGRTCGYAVSSLVAARVGRAVTEQDLRGMAGRPIAQPIRLGELAAELADEPAGDLAAEPEPAV